MSKIELTRELPEVDVKGRLVKDRQEPRKRLGFENILAIASVFRRNLRETTDLRNAFKLLPDLEIYKDTLVSAVIAPGDLIEINLIYESSFSEQASGLTNACLTYLETFFNDTKHLKSKVGEWVDDALVTAGSHPILIIPNSVLDNSINGDRKNFSIESLKDYGGEFKDGWYKPTGWLGGYSAEGSLLDSHTIYSGKGDKKVPLSVRVTDNLAILRKPLVEKVLREQKLNKVFGKLSLESRREERLNRNNETKGRLESVGDNDIYNTHFRPPQSVKVNRIEVLQTNTTLGDGRIDAHPIEYHLSAESVMPVIIPGDPKSHIGYLILLGEQGYPISYSSHVSYYDDVLRNQMNGDQVGSNGQMSGEMLNMGDKLMNGSVSDISVLGYQRVMENNMQVITSDIIARLKDGANGGDFEISYTENISKMMLARTFKNQMTTLLYVPAELMIYMAYDYNEFGVGTSILEKGKSLIAMRAALQVAHVIGSTRNAIPGKDLTVTLDPDDEDPMETAVFAISEAIGLDNNRLPWTMGSTQGIAEQLQLGAYNINLEGNERMPEMKSSIQSAEGAYRPLDQDLRNEMREDTARLFSQTPEMVDGMNQADFATTVLQSNARFTNRVIKIQDQTNPFITDYVRRFTYFSGKIINDLLDIVEENKKELPEVYKDAPEDFLQDLLDTVTVSLAKPEINSIEKQIETYRAVKGVLPDILEAYLKEEYLDGTEAEAIKATLPTLIEAIKGEYLRNFLRKHQILPELDFITKDAKGSKINNLAKRMSAYQEAAKEFVEDYAVLVTEDALKRKKEQAKALDKLGKGADMVNDISGGMQEPEQPDEGSDIDTGSEDFGTTESSEEPDENMSEEGATEQTDQGEEPTSVSEDNDASKKEPNSTLSVEEDPFK